MSIEDIERSRKAAWGELPIERYFDVATCLILISLPHSTALAVEPPRDSIAQRPFEEMSWLTSCDDDGRVTLR
jgi:hypothetical protein